MFVMRVFGTDRNVTNMAAVKRVRVGVCTARLAQVACKNNGLVVYMHAKLTAKFLKIF